MTDIRSIAELYKSYIERVDMLEKNRKFGEGIFGLKGGPEDDACHDLFAEKLEDMLKGFYKEAKEPDKTAEVIEYILMTPYEHPKPKTAYWMLIAVHAFTLPLIGRLDSERAVTLYEQYKNCYPRRERLPVQNDVLKALRSVK